MNQGRIEQVGGPRDLYEEPANEFVMSFVGPVNRFGERSSAHTTSSCGSSRTGTRRPARSSASSISGSRCGSSSCSRTGATCGRRSRATRPRSSSSHRAARCSSAHAARASFRLVALMEPRLRSARNATLRALDRMSLLAPVYRAYEWVRSLRGSEDGELDAHGLPVPPPRLRVEVAGTARAPVVPRQRAAAGGDHPLRGGAERRAARVRPGRCSTSAAAAAASYGTGPGSKGRRSTAATTTSGSSAGARRTFPFVTASVNELAPPLRYEDGQFDLVYAISVFTHLPHDLERAWIDELGRITAPGGLAAPDHARRLVRRPAGLRTSARPTTRASPSCAGPGSQARTCARRFIRSRTSELASHPASSCSSTRPTAAHSAAANRISSSSGSQRQERQLGRELQRAHRPAASPSGRSSTAELPTRGA